VRRFDLGTCARKSTGQQKSQKCYISSIWGEAPTGPIRPKSCMTGDVHDIITYAKFQVEIFMGYDFTAGRIFDFSIILIKNLALCMCSTMGSNTITLLESLTPICLFSRQLLRVMMTVTS